MRVMHIDKPVKENTLPSTYPECIQLAIELEGNEEIDEAIKMYKRCVKLKKTDEYAYDRLMILYRKKKEFDKELEVINEGINAFEKLYNEPSGIKTNKAIQKISNAILQSTGLSDKKGNKVFMPQPILRWHKRAMLLKKRLKK